MQPKVFISYSWSSPTHQELVKSWADRLLEDGIDVVLDIYDLKEGHNKFVFMESMVLDETISHVLVICDRVYSQKADAKISGVGTESQIISKQVYEKVNQTKFIPIICEYDEAGQAYTPLFISSAIYINFSSPEAVNENWETLVRLLHGKPLHRKPAIGKPPSYITAETSENATPSATKFYSLRQAVLQNKPGIPGYREDFLTTCYEFVDSMRVRTPPDLDSLGERVLGDCARLKDVRDQLVDWISLEVNRADENSFGEVILKVLEKILDLKSKPEELNPWNEAWLDALHLFAYELFIYIIATLMRSEKTVILKMIFEAQFLLPKAERDRGRKFDGFGSFWTYSATLGGVLKPADGGTYKSTAGELIKRQADRQDTPFSSLKEAELLITLASFVTSSSRPWYPQTFFYSAFHEEYEFFLRATQRKHFSKLQIILGGKTLDEIKEAVIINSKNLPNEYRSFSQNGPFWDAFNLDQMNTL